MITGETLRRLRTIKSIKQSTIAKKLGISQQAYSKIEKSKNIDEDKLNDLLPILGVTKEELAEMIKIFSR